MTILVTGGAGYIGSHTVVELLKEGKNVVIVDNFDNSKPEVLNRIKQITNSDFKFYQGDILDRDFLDKVFEENDIDQVIHFAGLKAVGESVEKPLKYYKNNVSGTITLLESMKDHGVKSIVFSSSATVYGMKNPSPFVETMPCETATNPYGYSKVVIEHILQDIAKSDDDWSIVLLRYFNPIGAHESGLIGEDPQGIPNNLMPYITQVAVGKREKLSVFGDDYDTIDGTGVRDYIHVVDLAKGHLKAIEYNQNHKGVNIFNLGTGAGVSVLQLLHAFEQAYGKEIPYQIVPRRDGDIATCYADCTKAKDELDWVAEKTIDDMCRDSWNWQSKNPYGYL